MKGLVEQLHSGERPDPAAVLDDLARIFPLIERMEETPQDPEWHAEGNVRIHVERVIAETYLVLENEGADCNPNEQLTLILGAALHDIGKTLTTKEEERDGKLRIVSPFHTDRGRSYVAPRLPALGLTPEVAKNVLGIIGRHHAPKSLIKRDAPVSAYFRLARSLPPRLVYLIELADLRGREMDGPDDAFETLELFRLGAEEADAWETDDPYHEWRETIFGEVDENPQYVLDEAIRDFEAERIHHPHGAIARTYEWRKNHPEVVLTCAPSGSGKSTWIDRHCPDHERISLDEIREELTGDRLDQSRNGEVLQLAKQRLRQHLRDRKRIVWDATTIRRDGRSMVIDLAHDYHAATRIVAFATPPSVIAGRNRNRKHAVPKGIIERQFDRLQWPEVWEAHHVQTVVDQA
ncbi:MAG: AAA family ATPase [Verrucomicrobiota bacterium]